MVDIDEVTIDLGRTGAADQTTDVRIAQHAGQNDPQFAALLFQYGRYLLISSSRSRGNVVLDRSLRPMGPMER